MTAYTIEFVGTGETITCTDKETILSRCLEEGIAQEYSCRVGMCLACSAEILEGEVTQPAARGLTKGGGGELRADLHGASAIGSETRSRQIPAEHRG